MAFLPSWSYRRAVTVTHALGSTQTDLQVKITVDTQTLISSGKMLSAGQDLRITDSNGVTLLPYWIESGINTSTTIIWVKVPSLPNGSNTIYLYYGNTLAADAQSGTDVFLLFDDFASGVLNSTVWDATKKSAGASISISSHLATFNVPANTDYAWLLSKSTISSPAWVEWNITAITGAGVTPRLGETTGAGIKAGGNLYLSYATDWDQGSSGNLRLVGDTGASGFVVSQDNPHPRQTGIWGHAWVATGSQKGYDSSTSLSGTNSTNAIASYYPFFGAAAPTVGVTTSMAVSWVRARKYVSTDPVTVLGSEVLSTDLQAYSLTIAGVDRRGDIIHNTVSISDEINDQANSLTFELIDNSNTGMPELEDEVIIIKGETILFGGTIVSSNIKKNRGEVTASIKCIDYTRLMDSRLVAGSYEDMTDKEIIEDIITRYCAGLNITTNNVVEGVTIDQISFNYMQPSQCLRRISELTGRNWYIDYEKDVHYFSNTATLAPFSIDSNTATQRDLTINKDASQVKNRVYVRGGTYLSDTFTYEEKGDGEKRSFVLPDKPHDITVAINGVAKTVGIKNINTSGYDVYLNFQEKYVDLDDLISTPGTGDTLTFTYKYDIPILVAVEDSASILEFGSKEFAIFDKSISSVQAARDRAQAELTDYANEVIEGGFTTVTDGFKSGQYLAINLTDYDVNANYIVQRVSCRGRGNGEFVYTITLASAKTLGIIKFLIELLEANKNLIELNDDEVVDELFTGLDSLNADSLYDTLVIDSQGPYFTWATDSLSTGQTILRWELGSWM